jgi:predicted nucleic acid-binding protein
MTQRYLLDTNLLVAVFDEYATTSDQEKEAAQQKLETLLSDDDVALSISSLIRYEVLRGIGWLDSERLTRLVDILNRFEEFDINQDISMLAADLYRFDAFQNEQMKQGRNLEKRKFDVFHFATAQLNGLTLASADTDIAKVERLYESYLEAKKATEEYQV